MRWIVTVAIFLIAIGTTIGSAAEPGPTIMLQRLESLDGCTATWGTSKLSGRIELNRDAKFTSEGAASLHLTAHTGTKSDTRYYAGAMIAIPPTDLVDRALLLDVWTTTPDATTMLYVRLYGSQGKICAGWVNRGSLFRGKERLSVQLRPGASRGGFITENEHNAEGLGRVQAVEIIMGATQTDVDFDVYVDALRASQDRMPSFAKITGPKRLYLDTTLAKDGKLASILVAPDAPEWRALANRLQDAIADKSGVRLPIRKAGDVTTAELTNTNALLLGNVACNRAMQPLYALLYTPVDAAYPPADGFLVHTVHDPWGTGHNALVLGGSTPAGAAKGLDKLIEKIGPGPNVILPKLTLFQLDAKEMAATAKRRTWNEKTIEEVLAGARRDFDRGGHRSVASRMGDYGFQYARTGDDILARLYVALAKAWYESYQAKPGIYGGPWGMDMDFHLMEILPAWDLLEESPALTDDDRWQTTKILFEFITSDVVRKATTSSSHVRHNHLTFPALGLFLAGSYFQKGYRCSEADHWLETARNCFELQVEASKPYEDCNGYGWLVPYHTMRWALANGDAKYFDNGNVRRQADYAILTMDNLGYQVPYGDTGSYQCWWTEIPFLRGAAYYHGDGRYAWALEKKLAVHANASRFEYDTPVAPQEPKDLLGLKAIPLDRMYWETFDGPKSTRLEKAVDKVVMRSSFDPNRQYLLLDGLSNGGHRHFDGNSISRITDRGRIWLADNDYIRALPKFHNGVLVLREGQADTIPAYCELLAAVDQPDQGFSQTAVRAYNGVDWRRSIVWAKERFFLVVDDLLAREPGAYDFHCLWHVVGDVKQQADGLEIEQQGPRMFIKHAQPCVMKLTDNAELGRNWSGYAYAQPMVHSLRQVQSATLETGKRVRFANLIYTTDKQSPQDLAIASGPDDELIVQGGGRRWIAAVGAADKAWQLRQQSVSVAQPPSAVLGESAQPRAAVPPSQIDTQPLAPARTLWSFQPASGGERLLCSAAGDLDGDGRDEVLCGSDQGRVYCLSGDGKLRWTFAAGGPVTTVAIARRDGGRQRYPVLGSEDARVYALDAAGKEVWRFEMPYYKGAGRVRVLLAADVDADGNDEIIAGGDNWRYYTLDHQGQERWHYESVHPSSAAAAADLDGDGKLESLLGTVYYWWHCAGPDGSARWKYSVQGPHATVALAARFDGGKTRSAIFGAEDGNLYVLDPGGKLQWRANVGDEVRAALAVDLEGDGREQLVAASESFNVFAFDGTGKILWRRNLGDSVMALIAADVDGDGRPELIAGCDNGFVFGLDRQGKPHRVFHASGGVRGLTSARLEKDAKSQVLVRTLDGPLTAIAW